MNTEVDRKIAVILVADVVGYSKHMESDENATLKAYAECEKILKTCLKKYKGSIFNTAGDSALAEFPSAVNAVECGVAFQNDIKKRNKSDKTEVKLEFRIGINMGDVVKKEGNLFGDGVNIAARLEALAQPNGISISKSVYDLVVPKTKMTFNDLGVQKVKQNEFHAFDILLDPSQKRTLKTKSNFMLPILGAIAAVLTVSLIGFVFLSSNEQEKEKFVVTSKPLVVVAPVSTKGLSEAQLVFNDGLTNSIISSLSKFDSIRVGPEKLSNLLTDKGFDQKTLNSKHRADFLINSSLLSSGEQARINIEVISLEKNEVISSSNKLINFENIFQAQDILVSEILNEMQFKVMNDAAMIERWFKDRNFSAERIRMALNWRKEFSKFTINGYVKSKNMLKELEQFAKTRGNYSDGGFAVPRAWQTFQGAIFGMSENIEKDKEDVENYLNLAVAELPGPNSHIAKAYLGLVFLGRNCEESMAEVKIANAELSTQDSLGIGALVYATCGKRKMAIEYARSAREMAKIDTDWVALNILVLRLFEDGQEDEIFRIVDKYLEAIDLHPQILAVLTKLEWKRGNKNLAKDYYARAKDNGFDENLLKTSLFHPTLLQETLKVLEKVKSFKQ